MARQARKKSSTGIYHVLLRGVNRQVIFETKEDGEMFLDTLARYKDKSGYDLYGYCLMNNHIHLLIKENEEDISTIMKRIGISYVYWYNEKYDRVGHLFQGRYKSEVVENESYLLNVLRYIHQNPTKAGIVDDIMEYRWSSYSNYIEKNVGNLIDVDLILKLFNGNRPRAIENFIEFHKIESKDEFLGISKQVKVRIKDNDGIEIIKNMCKIKDCRELTSLDKQTRDNYIRILKEEGLSTRQIERLTGISRYIVLRA